MNKSKQPETATIDLEVDGSSYLESSNNFKMGSENNADLSPKTHGRSQLKETPQKQEARAWLETSQVYDSQIGKS